MLNKNVQLDTLDGFVKKVLMAHKLICLSETVKLVFFWVSVNAKTSFTSVMPVNDAAIWCPW
ncbi:Hypothetical protein CpP54B96_0941 [Corynebacterium pseudotuberculosis P54B96]|nr:Hypothetical protein CpP54B96_0941 [Corynebacterium pseudotuberculosis P54B96]